MNRKRGIGIIFGLVVMLVGLAQGGVTISPSSPNASESFTVAPSDTAAFSVSIADGSGYVLKSSGFSTSSSSDGFVWVGGGSGGSFSFSIMNSEWITETAVATVTCVWTPAGGGGGGGGTPLPDIYGSAVGTATAGKGTYKVQASEDRAPAGASVGVAATLEDGKGGTQAAESDWTVGGAGELQGPGQGVSAIQVKGKTPGNATATGVYCEDGSMSDSDEITFVGVKSVSCQTITSTTDTPGTNETLYAAYQGTGQTFTVTAAADPGEPWPDDNPTWSGAAPVTGNPAQATVVITSPGEYFIRASCGDSAKALKIVVIKVEINKPIEVTRGQSGSITATLSPAGLAPSKVEWIFTGGKGGTKNTTPNLSTSVILVDGDNSYSVKCSVTVNGVVCEDTANITVKPRTGWTITPACATDNEPGWGSFPGFVHAGECRNRTLDDGNIITPVDGGFASTSVNDPNGPNNGYWYIESTTLVIDMETVINKYNKSGATPPIPPGINWYEYNESHSVDAAGCLTGIKGHEYKGVGGSGKGHFAFLETKESESEMDVNTEIEKKWHATSKTSLETDAETKKDEINNAIYSAYVVEPAGNWGPSTVYCYDFGVSNWVATTYGN